MDCRQVLEQVEALAADDIVLDGATREHVESCTRCSATLATARRIEAMLAARLAPAAPAGFTPGVIQRLRRERWRAEQNVDRLFNFAIAAAVVIIAGALMAIFNIEGLLALTASALQLVRDNSRAAATDTAPRLVTYVSAAALLGSALGMWWWAERRWQV